MDYEAILASEGLAPIKTSTWGNGSVNGDGLSIHRNWKYVSHRAPYYQAVYELAVAALLRREAYRDVLTAALLAEGASTDDIADALDVSHGTAHNLRAPFNNAAKEGAK